jgi:protein involved in temperature-dependent protein secretion
MSIETNLDVSKDKELQEAATNLLTAAMDYWKVYKKKTGGAAVVWVKDTDGRTVILTRGEYMKTLMANVHSLPRQQEYIFNYEGE